MFGAAGYAQAARCARATPAGLSLRRWLAPFGTASTHPALTSRAGEPAVRARRAPRTDGTTPTDRRVPGRSGLAGQRESRAAASTSSVGAGRVFSCRRRRATCSAPRGAPHSSSVRAATAATTAAARVDVIWPTIQGWWRRTVGPPGPTDLVEWSRGRTPGIVLATHVLMAYRTIRSCPKSSVCPASVVSSRPSSGAFA
jgi:hypothetical protein